MSGAALPWLADARRALRERLEAGRWPHAWLLVAPEGSGEQELAHDLAGLLLCPRRQPGEMACGSCPDCQWLAAGSHPDHVMVAPPPEKRQITVDQVREACARLALRPNRGRAQVLVLAPAEAMNVNAANALLKTLEEPSADATLVLCAAVPGRLPATVRSRCQQRIVRPPEGAAMRAFLATQVPSATPADLVLAAAMGGGPLGLAAALRDGHIAASRQRLRILTRVAEGVLSPLAGLRELGDAAAVLAALPQLSALAAVGSADDPDLARWCASAGADGARLARLGRVAQHFATRLGSGLSAPALVLDWLSTLAPGGASTSGDAG